MVLRRLQCNYRLAEQVVAACHHCVLCPAVNIDSNVSIGARSRDSGYERFDIDSTLAIYNILNILSALRSVVLDLSGQHLLFVLS